MCYHEHAIEWDALAEELGEEPVEREDDAEVAPDEGSDDGESPLEAGPVPSPSD